MIKNKRQMFVVIGVFTLVMLLGSVTYAFFNYTRTGTQNTIKVGRIAFNSTQNGRINLANVFPISASELENDENNHGEVIVNITGDTTYSAGMEYLLSFSEVNNIVNGKKVPIKYNVTPTNLGDEASSYWGDRGGNASIYHILDTDDIYDEKKIIVGYIKSGATGINGSVKIEAYIDKDEVAITDTEEENTEWQNGRVVLTTTEWNSLATTPLSFKIKVEANEGVWVGESPTPATCFATNIISEQDKTVEITGYNGGATYTINPNLTQEQITQCATYMGNEWGNEPGDLDEGETWEAFCDGTGAFWGDTFQDHLDNNWFNLEIYSYFESIGMITKNIPICGDEVEIPKTINEYTVVKIADKPLNSRFSKNVVTKIVIPNTVTAIGENAFYNGDLENVVIPNSVTLIGDSAFSHNQLTSVVIPNSVTSIGSSAFMSNQLTSLILSNNLASIGQNTFSRNQLTNIKIPASVTLIQQNGFSHNQLASLTIPSSVIKIEFEAFSDNKLPNAQAFIYNRTDSDNDGIAEIDITTLIGYGGAQKNVIIPDNVVKIGLNALSRNALSEVTIPNSVTIIEQSAFGYNQLESITIPNSVTSIGLHAFYKNPQRGIDSNPNLSTITIDKSCNEIKNNLKMENKNYYPWLYFSTPYTASGVTIYGANNEVCDTF